VVKNETLILKPIGIEPLKRITLYGVCWLLALSASVQGQSLLFSRLNSSNGLSDNNARCIAIDNNGFLWIGTNAGLNVYDGYKVTTFTRDRHPEMASDLVLHLISDSHNRIWMGFQEGAAWLDEDRKFHRILLYDSISKFFCPNICETAAYGTVLYTDKGQFYFDSTTQKWTLLNWIPGILQQRTGNNLVDVEPFSENRIIFTVDSLVAILDYKTKRIIYQQRFNVPLSACPVSAQEIAIGLYSGKVIIVNFVTGKTVREYQLTNVLNNRSINTNLTEVRRAANGSLLVATDFAGLIIIDKNGIITRHTHDPLKPGTISANNTYRSFAGKRGEIVVGTYTSGANVSNIFNKPAGYNRIFRDKDGNLFDNFLNVIKEESNEVFWIGAYDRLIRWDKKNDLSTFYYYYNQRPEGLVAQEVRAVCVDRTGQVWVGIMGSGLGLVDRKSGTIKKIAVDTSTVKALVSPFVFEIVQFSDGSIWGGSNGGVFAIDPRTQQVQSFAQHPVLKALEGKRVLRLFEDHLHRIWIGTGFDGVYCYNKNDQSLRHFIKDSLTSPTVFSMAEDASGNIYIGSPTGLSCIAPNGSITRYTRKNGLRYDRCEGILPDDTGNIWIANNKCLIKFNPTYKSMKYFEENTGLSIDGFRVGSFLKTTIGEMLWGSHSGINYFFPAELVSTPSPLQVSVNAVDVADHVIRFSSHRHFTFPYSSNEITFHFAAINLNGSLDIAYQYKLEGYDKEWHTGTDIREAHYSSLPAGNYAFTVKASKDRVNWTVSNNTLKISITPPIWQRWWFIAGTVLLITGSIFSYVQNRNNKIRVQREQLETEQAINYFASSMYDQQQIDNILWDVARNCIGRLQFEDCVIYLLDEERQVLVQKAAYGPKSPNAFEIHDLIEIPLGKGIVGSVAATGKAEIVNDTSKDPRYITDIEGLYSEITVPIVYDGKVLGIIDCEHSQKNFFTPKHLSILITIASLCANKIMRARAEEEKEEARLTLMETQQKMADVEMQALRAQMNPHFIFNCLNSINRYIVKSDQATASLYLTKFAKLIRLILDNSNSKNIILSNELDALKLYIDMEALRFDKKFSYRISVDDNVPADSIEVPPLIIQPYVENAIWHGLLHKQTVGHLTIHISLPGNNMLQCVIEDNGIGRAKARELRSKSATTKKSLGMKLTESRLALLNKHAELNASVEIIDLVEPTNEAAGTKVILSIPI
jgi:ligand-binding sensor domain-containing protein/putative methionine-R-sulfoxide reductase with GAF domain